MEIVEDRQGELRFLAPEECEESEMEAFVAEKRPLVYEKLAETERLNPPRLTRNYVSGENFFWLGRPPPASSSSMTTRRTCPSSSYTAAFTFAAWTPGEAARSFFIGTQHGRRNGFRVEPRLSLIDWAPRTRLGESSILGHRWGSCTREGVVNIHWAVMQVPPPVAE